MEYKLIEEKGAENLQRRVNQHLNEGWELAGGVCVVCSNQTGSWWYYQAVVKRS